MQEVCLEQIQAEFHRMKKQQVKNSRGPVFTPCIGGVVIFQPKKKYNMHVLQNYTNMTSHSSPEM